MAETLKLGNGIWATKENSLLSYNDENGNYKPLPFDFTRASSATVVNKAGLIETVGTGIPRIDFLGNTNGALKLEPQRTNLITYSEDFTNASWSKQSVTVASDSVISPDGTLNADKITDDSTNGAHRITGAITTSSSGSFTYSIFLKKGTLTTAQFQVFNSGTASSANVNLVNGTITSGGQGVNHTIEDYGNDWFKCSISGTLSNTSTTVYLYLKQKPSYIGNGDYLYAWGAQFEQSSYPTSYIPTQGSTVTRNLDSCSQTVPDGIIGQTEGTLYAEMNVPSIESVGSFSGFRVNDGTTANQISFIVYPTGRLQSTAYVGGTLVVNINDSGYGLTSGVHKIAIAYKLNDYVLYVDGSIVGSDTSATVPSVNQFIVSYTSGGSQIYNESKIYNTRLSNSELATLTTL